jgi:hypothetical protein
VEGIFAEYGSPVKRRRRMATVYRRTLVLALPMLGLILGAQSTPASAQAADPVIGTWRLNVPKSKYRPGPPPQSLTIRFETAGKGVKVTSDEVGADGQTIHTEYTADYDGKDYPLTGSATSDTVALKRIDARTLQRTDKKVGKVVLTSTRKISADGKVLTIAVKGTDAKGQPVKNVQVFAKSP